MQYSLINQNGQLFFECLDGGIGSKGPRLIKNCSIGAVDLLDRMEARNHLKYQIVYRDEPVSLSDWDNLIENEEFVVSDVSFEVTSDLDVITLCGFASVLMENRYINDKRNAPRQKYRKPTSKKEVKSSWLYQNATSA